MAEESRLEIVVDSRGSERTVRRVGDELGRLERVGIGAQSTAARTATGFGQIARQAQFAVPPVSQLTSLFGSLAGILGTRQIINYADAWQNAGNQLRQVTRSAAELEAIQGQLMGVANSTRSEFEATANLYSRLARSTTEMGLSQQDLIGLTRTINQSFAVSGATAGEAAAAITQLSQGLAAGALRGDEFNSVSEQAPGIMRAIAESLDMTIGDLRDFAAEGGITAQIVVDALQGASRSIEQDFGRSVETFGQKMTIARNNMLEFVGSADSVEGALANIGDTAITLSENLDAVAQAGILVAGVVGGRLVGRMATLAAGMTTAAGAAGALRTALAFLGGPAGILVAVGSGLFAFREELGLVPQASEDARKEIELLTGSLDDLNGASIDAAMVAINAQMFELERRARATRAELENLENSGSGALGMSAGATGEQARLLAEQGQISAERRAAQEQLERLIALREGTGGSGGTAAGDLSKLVPTREQEEARTSLSNLREEVDDGTEAVRTFSDAAVTGAQSIEAAARSVGARSADPRYSLDPDEGSFSSRARARFEASAFRVGDPGIINYAPNPSAKPTWSTAAYDAAGDGSAGRAAMSSMGAGSQGGGRNLGTLTLAKEGGGKINVQANADELQAWLADALSGAASAV